MCTSALAFDKGQLPEQYSPLALRHSFTWPHHLCVCLRVHADEEKLFKLEAELESVRHHKADMQQLLGEKSGATAGA